MSRLRFATVLAGLALMLLSAPAWAIGRVIPSSDGSVGLEALRVGVALSPGQTTLWSAFRVSGSASRVAVVLPVLPGSFVDPSSEAWFWALENATAPRVVPSGDLPVCGSGSSNSKVDNTAELDPTVRLHPLQVAVLDTVADLDDFAAANQLALSPADRSALDLPGQRLVALLYSLPPGQSAYTQALRITEPAELPSLPFGIARSVGSDPVPVTLWTIAAGRGRIPFLTELAPYDVKAVWRAFQGNSDYAQRRHELLAAAGGNSIIREASGNARLFGWTVLPGQAGSVPPAADAYFSEAVTLGDTAADPAGCAHAAAQARLAGLPVAPACAPGLLLRVPLDGGADPACSETPKAGTLDPDTLRCGAADDLALALSGLRADQAGLTRLRGLLGPVSPGHASIEQVAPDPRSPAVPSSNIDKSGCSYGGSGGTWGSGGYSGGGYSGGGYSGGGYSGGGYSGGGYSGGSYSGGGGDVYVDASCSSSSSSDSCSGDSSSSSDSCSGDSSSSDGSTCSGDSSSSDGSTCSGDSSSSDGSTCSGDSSSSDGATCSGDSSGADGATCSGSSGGDSSCALSRRPRHTHMSVWILSLAAVFLPYRRLSRRRQRRRARRRPGHRTVSAGRAW